MTGPASRVPAYITIAEAGHRILKRLALRGLVHRVAEGWIASPPLLEPVATARGERLAPALLPAAQLRRPQAH